MQIVRTVGSKAESGRWVYPDQSESVKAGTTGEMNALREVVRRVADSGSIVAKRDYAVSCYLLTGLRRKPGDQPCRLTSGAPFFICDPQTIASIH